MVFHYVNAWEEKNDAGDDIIRCYGCATPGANFNLDFREEHTFLKGEHVPRINRFIFNLTTGASEMTPLFRDMSSEFPTMDWNLIGYKSQYCYLSQF